MAQSDFIHRFVEAINFIDLIKDQSEGQLKIWQPNYASNTKTR